LRRMNTPLARSGKMAKPRQLHNTHWGMVCPAETPEGQAVGLVKNISLMCYITVGSPAGVVLDFMNEWGLESLDEVQPDAIASSTKVFVNGLWCGLHPNAGELTKHLRDIRRSKQIESEVCVVRDLDSAELKIFTDGGRATRPLYITDMENQVLRIKRRNIRWISGGEESRGQLMRITSAMDANLLGYYERLEQEGRPLIFNDRECWRRSHEPRYFLYRTAEAWEIGPVLPRDGQPSQRVAWHHDCWAMNPEVCERHHDSTLWKSLSGGNEEKLTVSVTSYAWSNLVEDGLIEYVDCEEEESCMVGMFTDDLRVESGYCNTYTHCEIHPSLTLGVCASIIPFPDHNQSPRNCYQSAMGKQAMGVPLTNMNQRMDTLANFLCYPQKPLVGTRAMEYLRFRELPAGTNVTVCIMCYSGYNQEDSLILNGSSLDRGLFRSVFYRCYMTEETMKKGRGEMFKNITDVKDKCVSLKRGDYSKLDKDGIAEVGHRCLGDDVLVGKVTELPPEDDRVKRDKKYKDCSVSLRPAEYGCVDRVMISRGKDGFKFAKVRMRCYKIPTVGDKFASRHGQKGTMGIMFRHEDMPFTQHGIVPDLVMNPHAVPSRMTIGHLTEAILGKVGSLSGGEGDATPFTKVTIQDVSNRLHELGWQRHGNEVMYNGHSGKRLPAQIFVTPTYYQRLKHMVEDKIHSRARGPVTMLVRQPMEGRAKMGGLRFGEMERDCMLSHGASKFLKERLMDVSDAYRIHLCDRCGLFAIANLTKNSFYCKACPGAGVSQVHMPYACKLMFQELMTMSIAPRMFLHQSPH